MPTDGQRRQRAIGWHHQQPVHTLTPRLLPEDDPTTNSSSYILQQQWQHWQQQQQGSALPDLKHSQGSGGPQNPPGASATSPHDSAVSQQQPLLPYAAEGIANEAADQAPAAAAASRGGGDSRLQRSSSSSSSSSGSQHCQAISRASATDQQQQQQQQDQVQIHVRSDEDGQSSSSQPPPPQQQQPAWREVIGFALPMLATLAADPVASLVDTAFVGHLGAAQLAGVGMAINIFSSITRLFNAPLLAVTTSAVAAASAEGEREDKQQQHQASAAAAAAAAAAGESEAADDEASNAAAAAAEEEEAAGAAAGLKQPLLQGSSSSSSSREKGSSKHVRLSAAVSAAIILALSFSLVEVVLLAGNCNSLVQLWGAKPGSGMFTPTRQFLLLRGLAAPVTVLLLVMQGVFRGLQDAKTPFYATLACNALNIALEPPFIFKPLNLGVRGSALATTLAQIVPLAALLLVLQRRYHLSFRGLDLHQLGAMFAPTGFLLLRTISISAVFAAATSLVARAGPLAAAAHQVAFQIWMATSLLADSLAVACQTILARSTAAGELKYARKVVATAITLALSLGLLLSLVLGGTMQFLPSLFTQDASVRQLAQQLMPIVAATQPLNALAFVSDGVLYGAGGFKYASGVMLLCAAPSLGLMFAGQLYAIKPKPQQAGQNLLSGLGRAAVRAAEPWQQQQLLMPADPSSSNMTAAGYLRSFVVLSQQSQLGYSPVSQPMWLTSSSSSSSSMASPFLQSAALPAAAAAAGSSSSSSMLPLALQETAQMPAAVYWVWAGMIMLMFMRAATILLPLACRCYPFTVLFTDLKQRHLQQQQQQQQQQDDTGSPRQHSVLSLRSWSSILAPQRMWTWLGRGSFLAGAAAVAGTGAAAAAAAAAAAGPAAAAESDSAANRAWIQKQDSKKGGLAEPLLLQTDAAADAEIGVGGAAAELGFSRPGKTLGRGSGFEPRYKKLSAAVADEEDLLAAKHASTAGGIPAGVTVCCKAANQQQQQQLLGDSDEAEDEFLVVLCGEDSTLSIVSAGGGSGSSSSSSSSSSPTGKSEILSGDCDE
uniref:Protein DETOXIFICATION n=1 Tax=Tetradesmus obliquus TaxID=3088 RepID=A0A383WIN5_TETOB|eukprot:jgi/Sobl393_1/571/SZX69743.1